MGVPEDTPCAYVLPGAILSGLSQFLLRTRRPDVIGSRGRLVVYFLLKTPIVVTAANQIRRFTAADSETEEHHDECVYAHSLFLRSEAQMMMKLRL
jgi:hypothetical protein